MAVTLIPITNLAFLDNSSLPLYLLTLSIGLFFFAGSCLNHEAYIADSKITEGFLKNFSLSRREGEIIQRALHLSQNG